MTDQTLAARLRASRVKHTIDSATGEAVAYIAANCTDLHREAADALDAQDERIKEVERLRDIAVMNKEEGDDIHAQEYNALLARADAAEKALAEARKVVDAAGVFLLTGRTAPLEEAMTALASQSRARS